MTEMEKKAWKGTINERAMYGTEVRMSCHIAVLSRPVHEYHVGCVLILHVYFVAWSRRRGSSLLDQEAIDVLQHYLSQTP